MVNEEEQKILNLIDQDQNNIIKEIKIIPQKKFLYHIPSKRIKPISHWKEEIKELKNISK